MKKKGFPMPVDERHEPFEKKCCARCNKDEFRIDGYCSIYCRDMAELEKEIFDLESTISGYEAVMKEREKLDEIEK